MIKFLKEQANSFFQIFKGLSIGKKLIAITLTSLFAAAVMLVVIWTGKSEYRMLYSDMSSEDAGKIIDKLREWKIPYQIAGGGNLVMIPQDDLYEVRLQLAGEGLPKGRGVGFEIFDKTGFGVTEFVQKLNFQRALQGELNRTISQFTEVSRARVHLVIPRKSLFVRDQNPPTASVVLKLNPGRRLRENQVRSIVYLVSNSVEGLGPENITVVDVDGNILFSGKSEFSSIGRLSNSQLELRETVERNMENRIQTMLEKAMGTRRVVVRVSALLNFRQSEVTEESYDPDSTAVRSEQRSDEKSMGAGGLPAGIPGVTAISPQAQTAVGNSQFKKTNETINYEVNKIVRRTIESTGDIKRLSVAVLVDGSYQSAGEGEIPEYIPRSEEDMNKIKNIVEKSMGYDAERGDQLEVINIPFDHSSLKIEEELMNKAEKKEFFFALTKYASYVVIFLLLFFLVVRPLMKWLVTKSREMELPASLPGKVSEGEANQPAIERVDQGLGKDEILKLVQNDPNRATELVRGWLVEKE